VKAHRLVVIALAGVTAFSLSGCDESGNHAAKVGDHVISTSDVDFLSRMQCVSLDAAKKDPNQASQVQTVSKRQLRASSLNLLIQSTIDAQIAKKNDVDYDRATYRQVMDQFEPSVQAVPAKDRERFRDLVGALYRGQLQVYALVQRKLGGVGVQPTDQQIQDAITAEETEYRKSVKIDVNPVYGAENGTAGVVDPSLSRAVSGYAKKAADPQADPEFVSSLPARMRCG
jgi:hypothetical protein